MKKHPIFNALILSPVLLWSSAAAAQTKPAGPVPLAAAQTKSADSFRYLSVSGEVPPAFHAKEVISNELSSQGDALLQNKDYQGAEKTFQDALVVAKSSATGTNPSATRGLAEVFALEGRTREAERTYRTLIYGDELKWSSVAQESRTRMKFAILLSQTGRWAEAVSVYKNGLSNPALGRNHNLDVGFDPQVPNPALLQALAHTAIGLDFLGHADFVKACTEFDQGTRLAPDSALVSRCYAAGWQHLGPADRRAFITARRAEAASRGTVKSDKPEVKAGGVGAAVRPDPLASQ